MSDGQKTKVSEAPEPDLHPEALRGKTVVIGIGNPYMKDDGIGIQVADEISRRELGPSVLVYSYYALDLSLLSFFLNASRVIIIDALKSGNRPGTVSTFSIESTKTPFLELPNLHELQLFDIMDLASQTGVLPPNIMIVGIEPADCDAGEGLTREVSEAIPNVISTVVRLIGKS
jgi:hydrogenase maturation protease